MHPENWEDVKLASNDLVKHDAVMLLALKEPQTTFFAKRLGLSGSKLISWIDKCREQFEAEINSCNSHTLILSSESLGNFSLGRNTVYGEIADYLGKFAPRIEVVLYARHPIYAIRSRYQHYVRVGQYTFSELEKMPWTYLYQERIEQLWSAFGRSSVIVHLFKRDFDATFDLVADFGQQLGYKADDFRKIRRSGNQSVSMECALLMNVVAETFPRHDAMEKSLLCRSGGIPRNIKGRPFRLSAELETEVMKRSASDIEFLEKELGISFPVVAPPTTDDLWGDETIRSLALALNRLTSEVQELTAQLDGIQGGHPRKPVT